MPKGDGLKMYSPQYQQMKEIVRSDIGRKLALEAMMAGLPALCGVDPLLRKHFGDQYNQEAFWPLNVGYEVAAVMREAGYTAAGTGHCSEGCIAKGGRKWKPKG